MSVVCDLKNWADLAEGIFGLIAAFFWFKSATAHWYILRRPMVGEFTINSSRAVRDNAIAAFFAGVREYWHLNSRCVLSVGAAKVGNRGVVTGRAEKSRAYRQKGLDFQREESENVLEGKRRIWLARS
jgi:hypothetical protein